MTELKNFPLTPGSSSSAAVLLVARQPVISVNWGEVSLQQGIENCYRSYALSGSHGRTI